MANVKSYGKGKCVMDLKDHEDAVQVEFVDGSFGGPVWLCWRHFHAAVKARSNNHFDQTKENQR